MNAMAKLLKEADMETRMTRAVVQGYEVVRVSGACNMFDRFCVARAAGMIGCEELATVAADLAAYGYLLEHFGRLLIQYGIKQPGKV